MAKQFIREIEPDVILYRDNRTGIAWVADGRTGCGISIHSNISDTGSVRGMKNLGYWQKKDRTVRSHGFIYNIDSFCYGWNKGNPIGELEDIVVNECRCQGCLERLGKK